MPSAIHEKFLAKVHCEITRQLLNITEGSSSEFAKDISFHASTKFIPSDPAYGPHDPDGQFGHMKQRFPGLVTEIAYSQNAKAFRDLADEYILGSYLRVRALAAFDISYRDKSATVSVWRPTLQQKDGRQGWRTRCEAHVFRYTSGEPNLDPNSGLQLHLRDFASAEFCEKFGNIEGSIFISCSSLCNFLKYAESTDFDETEIDRPALPMFPRTPSPEEQLNTDDERDVMEDEESAA